jgi:hypothetical protein
MAQIETKFKVVAEESFYTEIAEANGWTPTVTAPDGATVANPVTAIEVARTWGKQQLQNAIADLFITKRRAAEAKLLQEELKTKDDATRLAVNGAVVVE